MKDILINSLKEIDNYEECEDVVLAHYTLIKFFMTREEWNQFLDEEEPE